MPAFDDGSWGGRYQTDLDALSAFEDILLRAAEGTRHKDIDSEYQTLRKFLLSNEEYADLVPGPIRQNRDLGAMWSTLKGFDPQWEPRRQWIRELFGPLFDRAEALEGVSASEGIDSASWTGIESRSAQLRTVKGLIPLAKSAIEGLIDQLSLPGANGGPVLDHREEAIEHLRKLHGKLGELLDSIESGRFEDEWGFGLAADAARYAKRAAKVLKNDPMPYLVSSLLLGIFSACGFPGIGGHLSGVALAIRGNKSR